MAEPGLRCVEPCLLCVEPDASTRAELRDALQAHLSDLDPVVDVCESLTAAETVLDAQARVVECIITAYDLPDGTGLELIDRARTHNPDVGGILFTTAGFDAIDTAGFETTVTEYISKDSPRALERLAHVVRTTVTLRSQTSYPLPEDEPDRLAALGTYEFDSARLGHSLERLTDLAALHFEVSGAEVNIIDEHHQETLTAHGGASSGESTARDASICTFTILEDDGVLVVEDVHEDPRFECRGDEFEARGVRSYLGATLVSSTGFVIGTVCVYSEKPRTFSQTDEAFLRDVAIVAMDLIEAHSRLAQRATPSTATEPGDAGEDT